MNTLARRLFRFVQAAVRDLAPLVCVIAFFQIVVLRQPFPHLAEVLTGCVFVVLGLTLFVRGLEMGLFPLGEAMAGAFVRKGSLTALLAFAFALGFGTTFAEPALIAIAGEAARVASEAGSVKADGAAAYAFQLRLWVATAVGVALVIGVFRILKGWPIPLLIICGYLCVVALTPFAPASIIGIAFDSGGVTTSTITVPLVAALGVGLARSIRGRNPIADGFGLIAFASLTPIVFVLLFGIVGAVGAGN
jgi:hypothetical protein